MNPWKLLHFRYDAFMSIPFLKMHGLGNDFVIIDGRRKLPDLSPQTIRHIADRRLGVGCDQVIVMEKSANADIFMRIYNPDGMEAGACGNATRCIADLYMAEEGTMECTVETVSGLLPCTRGEGWAIQVDMGVPKTEWNEIPLSKQCDTLHLPLEGDPVGVSMGNPHCVFFCENVWDTDVGKLGPNIEHDALFPERTNVEYVSVQKENHLRMKVWERGAGVTPACGSGACAVAVAAVRRGLTGRKVKVTLDGGDLEIEWRESDNHVLMTGPVATVFEGAILVE